MDAVEGWKEDLGNLLACDAESVPIEQFNEALRKSERWISGLDNLVDSLTKQVMTLRLAEAQWIPTRPQQARAVFGCIGEESLAK
jgi:hypothetical protein